LKHDRNGSRINIQTKEFIRRNKQKEYVCWASQTSETNGWKMKKIEKIEDSIILSKILYSHKEKRREESK
jgi:hypothetical protein